MTGAAEHFGDRVIAAVAEKGTPCAIGLDPMIEKMPAFLVGDPIDGGDPCRAICAFNQIVIEEVGPLVPAVKAQAAFYEQYGIAGMRALARTIAIARRAGLLVIVDAKRNDIGSTAAAYARAFLGGPSGDFDADAITVTPFLGRDSLEPFVCLCEENQRGIFVLVKTSNPGSADIQDRRDGETTTSALLASMVDDLGSRLVGRSGYSSVGAVVGATFPAEAEALRARMRRAIVLVPGYGAQGGIADGVVPNFNPDSFGALVSSSRAITYGGATAADEDELREQLRARVEEMRGEVATALRETNPS